MQIAHLGYKYKLFKETLTASNKGMSAVQAFAKPSFPRHDVNYAEYLCGSISEDQVLDAGLDSDVGSDQQLQSTNCWELLRGRGRKAP